MTVTSPDRLDLHAPLADRRSTRAFSPEPVDAALTRRLLEAARWAPSAMNRQPWRFLVGHRGDATHDRLASALLPGNLAWAPSAGLLVAALARTTLDDQPDLVAAYELGLAVSRLEVQAWASGLVTHQIGGFDADALQQAFAVPTEWQPVVILAVGHPGDPGQLPEPLAVREAAPRSRLTLEEIAGPALWQAG